MPTEDGVEVTLETDGPICTWNLEFAFRAGGAFEDVTAAADGTAVLVSGSARYRVGADAIEVGPGTGSTAAAGYLPGEDYDYLGGTDALGGPRLYVTGTTPGRTTVTLRRVR